MRKRGGRMIVNPVRYGGGKPILKTVTIQLSQKRAVYYVDADGEYHSASISDLTVELPVNTMIVIVKTSSISLTITGASYLGDVASGRLAYRVDA